MLKFSAEVGTSEIHTIDFQFNQIWKSLRIAVDGKPIAKKSMNLSFHENKEYTFKVGNTETHEVKIELKKSLFPVGYSECTVWVYVDGEKIKEYTGKTSSKDRLFSGVGFLPTATVIAAAILMLSIIVGLIVYIIPIKINKTLNGVVLMTGDSMPDYIEHKEILIDGRYYRKIFKADEFYGKLIMDEYLPEPSEDDFQKEFYIYFHKVRMKTRPAQLYYVKKVKFGELEMIRVGTLRMKPHGGELMLTLEEENAPGSYQWSSGDGLIFCAPASNREEALQIGNGFMKSLYGDAIRPME